MKFSEPRPGPVGRATLGPGDDRYRRLAVDAASTAAAVVRCSGSVLLSVLDDDLGPRLSAPGLGADAGAFHLLSNGSLAYRLVLRDRGESWQLVHPSTLLLACARHDRGHLIESARLHKVMGAAVRRPSSIGVASIEVSDTSA